MSDDVKAEGAAPMDTSEGDENNNNASSTSSTAAEAEGAKAGESETAKEGAEGAEGAEAAKALADALSGKPSAEEGVKAEASAKGGEGKGNKNNLPIRTYLDQTVVPILLSALSQLVKERPDGDPVEWLAHWLLRNNPAKKTN
mmetsp:Transcript_19835/g.38877  ORF Transcript_19835/g.38877 Transcript_19835/m.38877 type:complete len:143 (+) Transcript_19835:127-555(+)|eukprot:CAMPEP_0171502678 /NCGR_PEP_ID=MMETSP0958-20121227/10334_1 /TAXON_ID=87120 /ORGANISM="Aurantiochytrium limacinum, Strain ATCCMYA-1381" /LENGTH=142 /DNA_ID=CAMNT_0012037805 /DNA_START=70 /DNA_END=498 /DNA_ORIENTATION=+